MIDTRQTQCYTSETPFKRPWQSPDIHRVRVNDALDFVWEILAVVELQERLLLLWRNVLYCEDDELRRAGRVTVHSWDDLGDDDDGALSEDEISWC